KRWGPGGPGWPRRDGAVESLPFALDEAGDKAGCAQAAIGELPRMERGPSFANVAGNGLSCALAAGTDVDALVSLVTEALDAPGVGADRVSELYELLVQEAKKRDDRAAVKAWAEKWLACLEGESARAQTADARSVYDAHRLSAALELKRPERAAAALEQSERDLPRDFNPPARLCVAYLRLGRTADAEAACRRALSRGMDGPRRPPPRGSLADLLEKNGDRAAALA